MKDIQPHDIPMVTKQVTNMEIRKNEENIEAKLSNKKSNVPYISNVFSLGL